MPRVIDLLPRVMSRLARPGVKNNRSARISIIGHQQTERCSSRDHGWRRLSTSTSANGNSEDLAAVAASYYNEPMNIRYHHQVWGDEVHIGRYDLLNEEDAKLEGLALMNRAAALTNEMVMNKLFPDAHDVNDETTVMEMGAGYGEFARALVKKHGCKVVCIDMCSEHNAINTTRTAQEGLQDKISIPGERSYFETGVPSASMDRVVGMDCYLHANGDTGGVMKEAARVLKRGSLMVFTDLMQADGYTSGMEKLYNNIGVERHCRPGAFKKSGKQFGMELVNFEDHGPNISRHYENLLKMIASLRGNTKDVPESMLDEKEARCLLFAEAADRGALIWGSFVFKRDSE